MPRKKKASKTAGKQVAIADQVDLHDTVMRLHRRLIKPVNDTDPDPVKWLEANRFLKGKPYTFRNHEFLIDIARDKTKSVYLAKGRQLGATELAVGLLLHFATLNPGTVSLYITSNLERAKFFSKYRLKSQTVQTSPKIAELFNQDDDLVLSRMLNNGSLLLFRSSQGDFEASRALPVDYMVIDEAQDMNLLALPVARESMSASPHGRLLCIGTGQVESGSWEKTFHTGQERHYDSKSKKWKILEGTSYNNTIHSYYLPQSATGMFTAKQIQEKIDGYLSKTIGRQEIEAEWSAAGEKPFPESVMRACLIPHAAHSQKEDQYLGIDLGGSRSKTCMILIHETNGIFYVDDARLIETKNVSIQAQEMIKYIDRTNPKAVCVDIGGGIFQTQTLEAKYGNRLVKGHLMANLTNPFEYKRAERLANIDKTNAVDELIQITQDRFKIPQKFEWICRHFTNVQSMISTMQGGGYYTKYYVDKSTQVDDACMAALFAIAAHKIRHVARPMVFPKF